MSWPLMIWQCEKVRHEQLWYACGYSMIPARYEKSFNHLFRIYQFRSVFMFMLKVMHLSKGLFLYYTVICLKFWNLRLFLHYFMITQENLWKTYQVFPASSAIFLYASRQLLRNDNASIWNLWYIFHTMEIYIDGLVQDCSNSSALAT